MREMSEIISSIKEIKKIKNDTDVARLLGMKQAAFSERKQLNSIPFEQLAIFCGKEHISLNWLLFGEGYPRIISPKDKEREEEAKAIIEECFSIGLFREAYVNDILDNLKFLNKEQMFEVLGKIHDFIEENKQK